MIKFLILFLFTSLVNKWLRLCRFEHSIIVFLAVTAGILILEKPLTYALLGLSPAFLTAAVFILNDYFDIETDKKNKRFDRPLVSGEISRKNALIAVFILYAISLLIGFYAGFYAFIFILLFAFLSVFYTPVFKKTPIIGNVFVALTMSAPFLFANLIFSLNVNFYISLLFWISFTVGFGREVIQTARDVKGDSKIKAKTLPMVIGVTNAIHLGVLFILAAILMSLIPFNKIFYLPLILICDSLLLLSVYEVEFKRNFKKFRNYSLWAMLIGIIAFLLISF